MDEKATPLNILGSRSGCEGWMDGWVLWEYVCVKCMLDVLSLEPPFLFLSLLCVFLLLDLAFTSSGCRCALYVYSVCPHHSFIYDVTWCTTRFSPTNSSSQEKEKSVMQFKKRQEKS